MPAAKLTAKQQRFVEEYLVDLNASAAYKRAGYACKTDAAAEAAASRLLSNVKVREAVTAAQARLSAKVEIKAERVLEEYARLAFSDVGQILDFTTDGLRLRPGQDIPEDARRAIQSIKVKRYFEGGGDDAREVEVTEFRLHSKTEALAKLAAHLGLLEQKKPLQVDVTSGGQPLDRNSLTPADIAAAAALVAAAGVGLPADGRSQPVDPA